MKSKQLTALAISALILLVMWWVNGFAGFKSINNIFTDQLSDSLSTRPEIVIVAIDDESLQQIGSWPWDRSIFGVGLENILASNPRTIAVDVLFLEARSGDDQLKQLLSGQNGNKVIMGSKLLGESAGGGIIKTHEGLQGNNLNGYVNFIQDSDGKIRRVKPVSSTGKTCEISFSLSAYMVYLGLMSDSTLCIDKEIQLRNAAIEPDASGNLQFWSSRDAYTTLSYVDVLNNNFDTNLLKDKIVLIGSTALDARLSLNDNFTDVFGRSVPGVQIHANVINSYLNNSFAKTANPAIEFGLLALLLILSSLLYTAFKSTSQSIGLFMASIILVVIAGLVSAEYKYNFNFAIFWLGIFVNFGVVNAWLYSLQQREALFIKQAFGQYMNPVLLQQIINQPNLLSLGGQSKNMSVLFSDVRGFTTISEQMSSSELVSMLNDYLDYMSEIIISNGGTIDKYIGDAIMAIWNAPLSQENHEQLAIATALEMQKALDGFNQRNVGKYPKLNIGIGINSGEMTVGNIGGSKRFDYTVLGDNVNLAARLEGLTKKYGVCICVTGATVKHIQSSDIIFRKLDKVNVKGKTSAVVIYEPMSSSPQNNELKSKYEEGFAQYAEGKFVEAKKTLLQLKSDKPAHSLVKRIIELEKQNIDIKEWIGRKGIWTWDEK